MSPTFGKCYDPNGTTYGIPTYPWRFAPDGFATRRQLRARGLRPGGQPVAAQVMRRCRGLKSGALVAYLYRIDRAKPLRPMTPARRAALDRAMAARRWCPACRSDAGYCIPTSLGMCVTCAYPEEQRTAVSARQGPTAHLSQRRPGPSSLTCGRKFSESPR